MKIITVVGARPQFVKAAAVSRKLRQKNAEILVHTGQHYDENMSKLFFEELDIPNPDYNLDIGSASHGVQTAKMLIEIEKLLLLEKPEALMVYGDTNSTLAGALAASKLLFPVIHIEAGLRSFDKKMPEEQNRVLCDHVSSYLFCPTQTAVNNLKNEGITKNVYNVGDVMCDAVLFYSKGIEKYGAEHYIQRLSLCYKNDISIKKWYLATVHRAENTNDIQKLSKILAALNDLDYPVIFPVHPRIKNMIGELVSHSSYGNIVFTEPLGYFDMLYFTKHAEKIITDSGGLQKEAYILDTPCVTLRNTTEWVETLKNNFNILANIDQNSILKAVYAKTNALEKDNCFGNGDAADRIISCLNKEFNKF